MKIAIINDTHLGVRNSSDIFLENWRNFFEKTFFPYCVENDIKRILHLGDFFDNRKFISIKSLSYNRRYFLDLLDQNQMVMDLILGNHDVYYKNTNKLNSPLEILSQNKNIFIHEKPTQLNYDGVNISVIPWINTENYQETMEFVKNDRSQICVGHFEFAGFYLMRGMESEHGMDHKLFNKYEFVLSGHYHTSSSKDNVLYLGSQMEFTWSDAHDPKYFYIYDTETRELEKIENPYRLFEKIEYDDTTTNYLKIELPDLNNKFVKVIVVNKKDPFVFDKFIERLQQNQLFELKIAENFSEFIGANVDDEQINITNTEDLLTTYIDAVDTPFDKAIIKSRMRSLFVQAQNLEFI